MDFQILKMGETDVFRASENLCQSLILFYFFSCFRLNLGERVTCGIMDRIIDVKSGYFNQAFVWS